MESSGPNGQRHSMPPPYDGTDDWLETLPIWLETTARTLQALAATDRTGMAAPELLHLELTTTDADVSLVDTIEWLLLLEHLGFIRLFTALGVERFALAPPRNNPETFGKGGREGAGERASAGEPPPRPDGRRRLPPGPPPRFCPEHMPYGTDDDCWACARKRDTRQAFLEEQRDVLRRAHGRTAERSPGVETRDDPA